MDLDAIRQWIARDDRDRAIRFVQELRERADRLVWSPERFPELDLPSITGVRRVDHGRCRILYRIEGDRVPILHVHHGSRDTPSGLRRERLTAVASAAVPH